MRSDFLSDLCYCVMVDLLMQHKFRCDDANLIDRSWRTWERNNTHISQLTYTSLPDANFTHRSGNFSFNSHNLSTWEILECIILAPTGEWIEHTCTSNNHNCITTSSEIQFSIRFLLLRHGRFANATQVSLWWCKSDW